MSNFSESQNKIAIMLQEYYLRHKELDKSIEIMYKKYAPDEDINRLKTKKLWLKDEIHRLEAKLHDLG